MNYSQQEIKKKQEKIISKSGKMKYRIRGWIAYCSGIGAITLLLLFIFGLAGAVRGVVDSAPGAEEIDIMTAGQPSEIYDSCGNIIQVLAAQDLAYEYASVDQIPEIVQRAFISAEDRRFYEHHGVDMLGILQSVYSGVMGEKEKLKSKTITQQLIQNQILNGNDNATFLGRCTREIQEQYLAIELEEDLDKGQILEYYLNTVNMGQNIMGVQAAATRYFDKDIEDVNVSEATVLAAIVSDPEKYSPVSQQENNSRRRKDVLKAMLEARYISEEEYEDALGDDVYLRIQNVDSIKAYGIKDTDSYYADAVNTQVIRDLKEKLGYSQTEAYNVLYHGGLKIFSCQDSSLQEICDEVINSDQYYPQTARSYLSYYLAVSQGGDKREYSEIDVKNYFYEDKGKKISLYFNKAGKPKKYIREFKKAVLKEGGEVIAEKLQLIKQPQASFVLIEQATGQVKAVVGGRGQKEANTDVNRAMELKRQPGSSLAMLSTYAPALDTAGITLGNVEDDTAYFYPGTNTQVRKWEGSPYHGLMTLREAIKGSENIPAVKTLEKVSVQTGYEFLKKFSLTTIIEQKKSEDGQVYTDLQLQLALGELNEGVTNLELTAAYAAIAGRGVYRKPAFYTKIIDRYGNVLLENEREPKRILKESTAWLLTDAMEDAVKKGTGQPAQFDSLKNLSQAWNVGYTEESTDYWFEGFTPFYTAGIWVGRDENTSQERSEAHIAIWKEIMERVHKKEKKTKGNFRIPDGVLSTWICSKCGNRAVQGLCDEAMGSDIVTKEYFVKGTEPQRNCDCHVKYAFCKESGMLASELCPEEERFYKVLLKKDEVARTDDYLNTVEQNMGTEICDLQHQK